VACCSEPKLLQAYRKCKTTSPLVCWEKSQVLWATSGSVEIKRSFISKWSMQGGTMSLWFNFPDEVKAIPGEIHSWQWHVWGRDFEVVRSGVYWLLWHRTESSGSRQGIVCLTAGVMSQQGTVSHAFCLGPNMISSGFH